MAGASQFFVLEDAPITTYYFQALESPVAGVATQTMQTTDLGDAANPEGEFVIFGSDTAPLDEDTITFTLECLYGGGAWLGGVQLVAVPAP